VKHQQYLQQFVHHTAQAAQCQAAQAAQAAHENRAYFQGQHSLSHPPTQHYSEPYQNQSVYPSHTTESYLTQEYYMNQRLSIIAYES